MDAVLAVATALVDGAVVQRAVLATSLVLAGLGAARLVPGGRWTSAGAATLAVWNPYVAERLLMGHWGILLAYAAVPWGIAAALDLRRARPAAGWRLLVWLAVAGVTAPGAVVAASAVLPTVLWPGGSRWARRSLVALLSALAANLPWLLPATLHPAAGRSDAAAVDVFAVRADVAIGRVASLMSGGGIWNADAVPASRGAVSAAVFAVLLVVAAVAGYAELRRTWGRGADGLLAGAVLGLLLALWGAWSPNTLGWAVENVPGAGLLRDGHRLAAPWVVLTACAAPLGVSRVVRRLRAVQAQRLVAAGLVLLPVVVLPDLSWGLLGRLAPVPYPAGWHAVHDALASRDDTADVVSLPWQAFRRYPWNDGRAVLDPLPRFVDRTVVTSADLPVARPGGVATIAGEDVRARRVGRLVGSGRPLVATMPTEGIGWAVVQYDTPGAVDPALLEGATVVVGTPSIALLRLTDPATLPSGSAAAAYRGLVLAVDVAVLVLLLVALVEIVRCRSRAATVPTPETRGGAR